MYLFILGIIIGAIITSIWELYFNGILVRIKDRYPFCILEHYHSGLILLIISTFISPTIGLLLQGIGVFLIIDERYQSNPFGIGKQYQNYCLLLGIILTAMLLIKFLIDNVIILSLLLLW